MLRTVRSKFSLIYIGLVILIVLLGLICISSMVHISTTINGLITTNYNSITRLSYMGKALENQNLCLLSYLYERTGDKATDAYEEHKNSFLHYYTEERKTIILVRELEYIQNIESSFEEYVGMFEKLRAYDLDDDLEFKEARDYYYGEIRAQQAVVENRMNDLYVSNETALFARRDEAAKGVRNSIGFTAAAFLAAAVVGYLLATLYTRRFFAPLHEITENIKVIREGNLRWNTNLHSQDEFGMMADEFASMVARLAEFERSTLGSLMSEKNKADSLVKSVNDPMLAFYETGAIVLMNEAFRKLYNLDDSVTLATPVSELSLYRDIKDYMLALKGGEKNFPQDKIISVLQNESSMFFHISATLIPGTEQEPAGLIMILHDVTEMMLLEKARGDYIATISHELKTPLTSVIMGADLLTENKMGALNAEQYEIVETIREDGRRLEGLVGEILELSRMESSKMLYHMAPCDISEVLAASVKQFVAAAERNNVQLVVECPINLPRVRADFSKITWVLNNLLSNALKYTEENGVITVGVAEKEKHLEIFVSDTGIGIPPEYAERIFEKYVQIKEYDIEVRGSGLGLAAAKEIINAHGGKIWCDTSARSGSRFIFILNKLG